MSPEHNPTEKSNERPDHGPLGEAESARGEDAARPRKAADKSARTRAREFALQALYQHLVGRNAAGDIDAFTRDLTGFHKCDSAHYDALLHGCIAQATQLDELLAPFLDRPVAEVSPIEHGVLWIGAYELQHCLDVPLRVVLNECIELAKAFGGTDGHKYINGVLHPLGQRLRPLEASPATSARRSRSTAPSGPTPALSSALPVPTITRKPAKGSRASKVRASPAPRASASGRPSPRSTPPRPAKPQG